MNYPFTKRDIHDITLTSKVLLDRARFELVNANDYLIIINCDEETLKNIREAIVATCKAIKELNIRLKTEDEA